MLSTVGLYCLSLLCDVWGLSWLARMVEVSLEQEDPSHVLRALPDFWLFLKRPFHETRPQLPKLLNREFFFFCFFVFVALFCFLFYYLARRYFPWSFLFAYVTFYFAVETKVLTEMKRLSNSHAHHRNTRVYLTPPPNTRLRRWECGCRAWENTFWNQVSILWSAFLGQGFSGSSSLELCQ